MIRKLSILTLALILLFAFCQGALADAGGFSGDSDYGGGWDSGSDWGSDWDSDWDSGGDFGLGGTLFFLGGGGGGMPGIIIVIILVVIVYGFIKGKGKGATPVSRAPGASYSAPRGNSIGVEGIKQKDPEFSEQAFLEMVSNTYVKMQNAWTKQDWEPMRMLMSDALFAQFKRQLDELKSKGYVNHVERIAVLGTRILGCYEDAVNQIITVELRTRIVDYTVDKNGNVVQGSRDKEKFMGYEWTLIRSKDSKTESFDGEKRTVCPACGAPLSLNASNRCEYCGTLLQSSEYSWVVSAIRGLYQQTGR